MPRAPASPSASSSSALTSARAVAGLLVFALAQLAVVGCQFDPKVPIVDIGAGFTIADASWFGAEETLFVFYRVDAAQGLSDASEIELSFLTDDAFQDFQSLAAFAPVHEHVAVTCGVHTVCGSMSIHVARPPRAVRLRLRYHRDGELTLDAPLTFTTVRSGPAHTNRSAIVYGVMDADNAAVQWRLRHQFPTIRNPDAERLGLRRFFSIEATTHGSLPDTVVALQPDNPYGYGLLSACPASFVDLGEAPLSTTDRAAFEPDDLPLSAADSALVCGRATVTDALGTFTTTALAQKNPQTAPAFAELRTPVAENTMLRFMLQTCDDIVSEPHRLMQLQRLRLSQDDVVCVDDFADATFVPRLARRFQDRIDSVRIDGDDMVLVIGLNRADGNRRVADAVEAALSLVVTDEANKSSPRLSGAFVFDSAARTVSDPAVARQVLWCPSTAPGDVLQNINADLLASCAVQADTQLVLGPLRVASLPILPSRRQYLNFVDDFSEPLAGTMQNLSFRAPTRTPLSESVNVEDFAVATFFNNEAVTAQPSDSFSFCPGDDVANVVFRVRNVPFEDGTVQDIGPLPLSVLPDFHDAFPVPRYELGLLWDFPYLVRLRYETFLAGAVTVADFTVPFGPAVAAEDFLGSGVWFQERFNLRRVLLQCDRFCGHPTFDSAGVYNVLSAFNLGFRNQCYRPVFPARGDGGFPIDP